MLRIAKSFTNAPIGPQPSLSRDDEVRRFGPVVYRMVRQMAERVPSSVDRESLFSAGMLGLLDAMDKYDDHRCASFEAYARIRIRGAILDELRGLDHLTRTQRRRSRAVAESRRELEKHGQASDTDVAESLGWSVQEVQSSRQRHVPPSPTDPSKLETQPIGSLWGDSESALDRLEKKERLRAVSKALATLPERNRLVVGLYYESEITLQEIGDLLGVTQSRVSQILKKTLHLLRDAVREELS